MLVNDMNRPTSEPNSGAAGLATLADYKSWRRLALAVRASVIKAKVTGASGFLWSWASDPNIIAKGALLVIADPPVSDLVYPKVPMGAGKVLAMGGAKLFTDKVPDLVAYAMRGNDLVPEGEGTYALEQARKREAKPPGGDSSALKVFAIGVGTAATAGLVVFAVTEILKALKGKG